MPIIASRPTDDSTGTIATLSRLFGAFFASIPIIGIIASWHVYQYTEKPPRLVIIGIVVMVAIVKFIEMQYSVARINLLEKPAEEEENVRVCHENRHHLAL